MKAFGAYWALFCFISSPAEWQKHYGEVFFGYLAWYGAERAIVEGLRTDSLYIGSTNIRVSQVLAAALFIVGVVLFILARKGVFEKDRLRKENRKNGGTCDSNRRRTRFR